VDYLYWGPREQQRYSASPQPWRGALPVAAQDGEVTIYRLPSARY
jgi:hypothetical protein